MTLYAAYGSNLLPERLRARVDIRQLVGTAMLPGYSIRFHKRGRDGSGKCDLIETDGLAHVAIYRLTLADVKILNRIEGVGEGYALDSLKIPPFGNCLVYRAEVTHIEQRLLPYCWYKALVLAGCEYWQFPPDYSARIAEVPCRQDPDETRDLSNRRLIPR